MEVKTRPGGSGFITLLSKVQTEDGRPYRLAYLRIVKEVQPVHPDAKTPPRSGTYRFHELWNEPIWTSLSEKYGGHWKALVDGLADGNVIMRRLIRSPADGRIRIQPYLTEDVDIEAVDLNDVASAGHIMVPMEFTVTGYTLGPIEDGPAIMQPTATTIERSDKPIRVYVLKVDDKAVARVPEGMLDKLPDTIRDLKLQPGQTISITG